MSKLNKQQLKSKIKKQIGATMLNQEPTVEEVQEPQLDIEKIDRTRSARRDALSSTQEALADTLRHLGSVDNKEDPELTKAVKSLQNAVRYLSRTTDLINDFIGNMIVDMVNFYGNIRALQNNGEKTDQKAVVALAALETLGITREQFQEIFNTIVVPQYTRAQTEAPVEPTEEEEVKTIEELK